MDFTHSLYEFPWIFTDLLAFYQPHDKLFSGYTFFFRNPKLRPYCNVDSVKFLFLPKMGLLGCQASTEKNSSIFLKYPMYLSILVRVIFLCFNEIVERRHGEPIKFLFLPKMGLLGSQASTEKKKLVMNYELLLRAVFSCFQILYLVCLGLLFRFSQYPFGCKF